MTKFISCIKIEVKQIENIILRLKTTIKKNIKKKIINIITVNIEKIIYKNF